MNRSIVMTLAFCCLGTACSPTTSSKGSESPPNAPQSQSEVRDSLNGTPQPGAALLPAQVEDFRSLIRQLHISNIASLILVSPDETAAGRARREATINSATGNLAKVLTTVKRDCQIVQPELKNSGDLNVPGHELTSSALGTLGGERCPVSGSFNFSRTYKNETARDLISGGKLSLRQSHAWVYDVKDKGVAEDLGLSAERMALTAEGPMLFLPNSIFRADLHGNVQGRIDLFQNGNIRLTGTADVLTSGTYSGGGSIAIKKMEVEFHFQIPYKNVDYRLSIFTLNIDGKNLRKIFLNGTQITPEGFEEFGTLD